MKAVVLDFFGTLTDPSAEAGRRASFTARAAALGIPAEPFCAAMAGTFGERATGAFGDTRSTLQAVALRCGVTPTSAALDRATAVQREGAAALRSSRGARAIASRISACTPRRPSASA